MGGGEGEEKRRRKGRDWERLKGRQQKGRNVKRWVLYVRRGRGIKLMTPMMLWVEFHEVVVVLESKGMSK